MNKYQKDFLQETNIKILAISTNYAVINPIPNHSNQTVPSNQFHPP